MIGTIAENNLFMGWTNKFLARHRRNQLIQNLDRIFVNFHKACENLNYNFQENGELFVLETLANKLEIKTVFDVGANIGDWSKIAAGYFSPSRIFCFEIVPETYGKLIANCQEIPNIKAIPLGLSDNAGEINVYYSSSKSVLATSLESFSENFHGYRPKKVETTVTTGDIFCDLHQIDSIDFLKIDVEGYEPKVLKGFQNMLQKRAIKIIQFEYGYTSIENHFLLKDFYSFLRDFDMEIGKIYPNHVDFRDYNYRHENFLGPNYLAVHSSLKSIITALKN